MTSDSINQVLLRVGEEIKFAQCRFATEAEALEVASWQSRFLSHDDALAQDAAEFGTLASKRWHYYRRQNSCVDTIEELQLRIGANPDVELALMAVVTADWYTDGAILGVSHFRRTWYNNLYVDFLTTQPNIAGSSKPKISGIGTALLAFIVKIADTIQSPTIWGETTKSSAPFYKRTFALGRESDQFRFARRNYRPFLSEIAQNDLSRAERHATKRIAGFQERRNLPSP